MTPLERVNELNRWMACVTIPFDNIHKRIEELVGRSVWTHELALPDQLRAEIFGEIAPASMEDVLGKIGQLRGDLPVIALVVEKDAE